MSKPVPIHAGSPRPSGPASALVSASRCLTASQVALPVHGVFTTRATTPEPPSARASRPGRRSSASRSAAGRLGHEVIMSGRAPSLGRGHSQCPGGEPRRIFATLSPGITALRLGQISQFRAAFGPPSYRHDSDSASNLAVEPALALTWVRSPLLPGRARVKDRRGDGQRCQCAPWALGSTPSPFGRCRHAGRSLRHGSGRPPANRN